MRLHLVRRLLASSALAAAALAGVAAPAAHADQLPGLFPASVYSNGCAFPPVNTLLDVSPPLVDPTTGFPFFLPIPRVFQVVFRPACDMHDAGYLGGFVIDPLSGLPVNTATQSRSTIDLKFLGDLNTLCARTIPWDAPAARAQCSSIAATYYGVVRAAGASRFDASPFVPGLQGSGTRPND